MCFREKKSPDEISSEMNICFIIQISIQILQYFKEKKNLKIQEKFHSRIFF